MVTRRIAETSNKFGFCEVKKQREWASLYKSLHIRFINTLKSPYHLGSFTPGPDSFWVHSHQSAGLGIEWMLRSLILDTRQARCQDSHAKSTCARGYIIPIQSDSRKPYNSWSYCYGHFPLLIIHLGIICPHTRIVYGSVAWIWRLRKQNPCVQEDISYQYNQIHGSHITDEVIATATSHYWSFISASSAHTLELYMVHSHEYGGFVFFMYDLTEWTTIGTDSVRGEHFSTRHGWSFPDSNWSTTIFDAFCDLAIHRNS